MENKKICLASKEILNESTLKRLIDQIFVFSYHILTSLFIVTNPNKYLLGFLLCWEYNNIKRNEIFVSLIPQSLSIQIIFI